MMVHQFLIHQRCLYPTHSVVSEAIDIQIVGTQQGLSGDPLATGWGPWTHPVTGSS